MRISTIVLNWNAKALLEKYVQSYAVTIDEPFQLIVIDDASSDGSCELVDACVALVADHSSPAGVAEMDSWTMIFGDFAASKVISKQLTPRKGEFTTEAQRGAKGGSHRGFGGAATSESCDAECKRSVLLCTSQYQANRYGSPTSHASATREE